MSTPDGAFLDRFESASLAAGEWDHRAHLRMAYLQLVRHGWPGAIRPVRDGIQHLNRAHGVADGERGGYHETLTLCWLRLLADTLTRGGRYADSHDFLRQHPELLDRERVLRHYSRERLRGARARREFVLPDRAPLPALASPDHPFFGDSADLDDPIGSRRTST